MLYGELPEVELNGNKVRGVRVAVSNPPKSAILGLPSNEQMTERLDQQKSVRRNIGRRKSQTEYVPNPKADVALFEAIRIDKDGIEFDEYEAGNAVNKLTHVEVTECQREGDLYVIDCKTPFGVTKHRLNVPTQRDLQLYRRSVVSSIDLPHGVEELRYRIGPPVQLYDAVALSVEGYTPGIGVKDVPPHHKSTVIVELVQAIDDLDPAIDPNF